MELISLRCNRDLTSASSYGLGWYKYAIATQWYQFYTTDAWWFSLRRRNGPHFPDDIFKWIFWNKNVWISITISLKYVPMGPIINITALVLIMAWHRPGNKLLSETIMVSLLMHICITRPQWVNPKVGNTSSPWSRHCLSPKTLTLSQKHPFMSQKWMPLCVHSWHFRCLLYKQKYLIQYILGLLSMTLMISSRKFRAQHGRFEILRIIT